MKFLFVPLILLLMAMVVIALVRGIIAFLNSTREDLGRASDAGPSPMQLKQNRMMIARIKFQALAIIALVILLVISH